MACRFPVWLRFFLYQITPQSDEVPEFHWIVVGPLLPYPIRDAEGVDRNETNVANYDRLPNAYIWTGHPDFFRRRFGIGSAPHFDRTGGIADKA